MKIEWNHDNEVCVDDGVWRTATPVELHYREEAHRFRDLAARAWQHMNYVKAERWLLDFERAEGVSLAREMEAAGVAPASEPREGT